MGKEKAMSNVDEESDVSFETGLEELQKIVGQLEDGALGLQDSMQRFETGIGLLKRCYKILEDAEQRIEILTGLDGDGNPLTADFDAAASMQTSQPKAGRRPRKKKDAKTEEPPSEEGGADPNADTLF